MPIDQDLDSVSRKKKTAELWSSDLAFLFESRPNNDLVSPQLLASLYKDERNPEEVEENTYRTLLPFVEKLVSVYKEYPELEASSYFRVACAICPNQTLFRGWPALYVHAQNYWKRFPHQHQGYHRALTEVLKAEGILAGPTIDTNAWPPVLLLENNTNNERCPSYSFSGAVRRWRGLQGEDLPKTHDMELEEVLVVFRKPNGDKEDRKVVIYPVSEVGILNAANLTEAINKCPEADASLRVRVRKVGDPAPFTSKVSFSRNTDDDDGGRENGNDEATTADLLPFDYEKHHPLGTWATLKEIRETARVDSIIGKWTKGCSTERDFTYKWPFQRSKKLKEMEIKFQDSLHEHHALDAAGNEKLKAQLREIEDQLKKERLLWLKEVTGVREQFAGLEKDIKNEEARKVLAKHAWEARQEREQDARALKVGEDDESLRLTREAYESRLRRALLKKKQRNKQQEIERRDAKIRGMMHKQHCLRKQAEAAKEERNCIGKAVEQEEMMEAISGILGRCDCHKGGGKSCSS